MKVQATMNLTRQLNATLTMEDAPTQYFSHILEHRGTAEVVLESGILSLINVVTVVGNTLLCMVIYKNEALRTLTNIFIVFLAISDIVMGFLCIPFSLGVFIRGKWVFGQYVCRMQCFLIYFLALGSLQTLTMIAVNRYYRVLKSSQYRKGVYLQIHCWDFDSSLVEYWLVSGDNTIN